MFSRRRMGTFEGLCHNPSKSKMAGSNWLQTDEAVDVILCDLHVKKGFCSNPGSVKVEPRRKNAGSCLVAGLKKTWPWLLAAMSCFIVPSSTIKVRLLLCGVNVKEAKLPPCFSRTGWWFQGKHSSSIHIKVQRDAFPVPCSVSALLSSSRNRLKSFLHCDPVQRSERLGRRWQFIVANRQSRGFTP